MAKRIQRKRTKGWRMPANAVYVGRPTIFGNPFPWRAAREAGYRGTDDELKEFSVRIFREWIMDNLRNGHGQARQLIMLLGNLEKIRGKDLMCWCPLDKPCHADILLEIANR